MKLFNDTISKTGFLTAEAILSRSGIQEYSLFDEKTKQLENKKVFRSVEEVTCKKSLDTFTNLIVTDEHPKNFVNIENVKSLQKGSVSNITIVDLEDGNVGLKAKITITDKDLISQIKNGKCELSVGYDADLLEQEGFCKDEKYTLVQKNIRANHVAVVDKGRCGKQCKIILNKGEDMKSIKIGDADFEISDCVLNEINRIKDENSKFEDEVKKLKDEITKVEVDYDVMEKAYKYEVKNLKDELQEFEKKCELMQSGVKTLDSKMTILDMKKEIVKDFGMDVEDKDEAYLDVAIDIRKNKDLQDSLRKAVVGYKPNIASLNFDEIANKEI